MGLAAGNLRENIYNVESVALDIFTRVVARLQTPKAQKSYSKPPGLEEKPKKEKQ